MGIYGVLAASSNNVTSALKSQQATLSNQVSNIKFPDYSANISQLQSQMASISKQFSALQTQINQAMSTATDMFNAMKGFASEQEVKNMNDQLGNMVNIITGIESAIENGTVAEQDLSTINNKLNTLQNKVNQLLDLAGIAH